nr:hypothetical protein [Candidatus Njordarchaeota archaeon]
MGEEEDSEDSWMENCDHDCPNCDHLDNSDHAFEEDYWDDENEDEEG